LTTDDNPCVPPSDTVCRPLHHGWAACQRDQVEAQVPVVQCSMFYVLIFSLAAVLLIVAGVTTMSRRRRSLRAEEAHATAVDGHAGHVAHGTHPGQTGRRNRKAKRAQSQHDRRKRH
jgi:hypothetical protein